MARANAGDARAFEALYERYRSWMLAVAERIVRDPHVAHDVMHDVVIYWLRRFPGFVLTGPVKAFLYPAIKHAALDALRRARRATTLEEDERASDDSVSVAGARDLDEAVARLPRGQREVLLLHFGDDLTLVETARALEIPLGTVKSRLGLALAALRADPHLRIAMFGA